MSFVILLGVVAALRCAPAGGLLAHKKRKFKLVNVCLFRVA